MRTKLIGAALLAAGALSAMAADNVYSLNVVGYANVPVVGGGYTLVVNQFTNGANTINEVMASAPDDALALVFENGDYVWNIASGGAWYDYNTGDPSAAVLNPGKAFFYNNPGAAGNLTFVGEVPQGTAATGNALSMPLANGYNLIGTYTPQALELVAANQFPAADEALVLYFVNGDYVWYIASGGAWYDYNTGEPATLIPAVGQGFFYNNPGDATAWTRDFTVGP